MAHSCQLSNTRHCRFSYKASAHECATPCHLMEGLHDWSQASRIVPVRIHAEHLHCHEDKDCHRCVHERPIPSISLQVSIDPTRMINPHAHTAQAKSRTDAHCHSRITSHPYCSLFNVHSTESYHSILHAISAIMSLSTLMQELLRVMRNERRERGGNLGRTPGTADAGNDREC